MSLERDAVILEEFCARQRLTGARLTLYGLESAPVERERRVVHDSDPFFKDALKGFALCGIRHLAGCVFDGFKHPAAEQEFMLLHIEFDGLPDHRGSVLSRNADCLAPHTVRIISCHVSLQLLPKGRRRPVPIRRAPPYSNR